MQEIHLHTAQDIVSNRVDMNESTRFSNAIVCNEAFQKYLQDPLTSNHSKKEENGDRSNNAGCTVKRNPKTAIKQPLVLQTILPEEEFCVHSVTRIERSSSMCEQPFSNSKWLPPTKAKQLYLTCSTSLPNHDGSLPFAWRSKYLPPATKTE